MVYEVAYYVTRAKAAQAHARTLCSMHALSFTHCMETVSAEAITSFLLQLPACAAHHRQPWHKSKPPRKELPPRRPLHSCAVCYQHGKRLVTHWRHVPSCLLQGTGGNGPRCLCGRLARRVLNATFVKSLCKHSRVPAMQTPFSFAKPGKHMPAVFDIARSC